MTEEEEKKKKKKENGQVMLVSVPSTSRECVCDDPMMDPRQSGGGTSQSSCSSIKAPVN